MHELVSSLPKLVESSYEKTTLNYHGFGSEVLHLLFIKYQRKLESIRIFRYESTKDEDVIFICKARKNEFIVLLDPYCEVVCIWCNDFQLEIGDWYDYSYIEEVEKVINEDFL